MKISYLLEDIKIDTEHDGTYDVCRKLLPELVKIAFSNLKHKQKHHEGRHGPRSDDPDAYNFDFTEEALRGETDDVISHLVEALEDLKSAEIEHEVTVQWKALAK